MNQCAKIDAAGIILGGEIRNRTNAQKQTNKQTNKQTKKQPIYPHLAYQDVWMMNTQITNAHTKSAVERSSDKPESPSLNIASS